MSRTKQEVCDIVFSHAMKIIANPENQTYAFQIDDSFAEAYGKDSLPCFVGALIPRSFALKTLDACWVDELIAGNPEVKEFFCEDESFLIDIQRIHDDLEVDQFIPKLKELAKKNGLSFPNA